MPVLWFYEASAVLAREEIRGSLTAPQASEFIAEFQSLDIRADEQGPENIFGDVYRLAIAHRLTSYDAAYLELALWRDLPIATLDDDLIRASAAIGVSRVGAPD